MKNKKTTVILLAAVLIIWGFLLYKVVSSINTGNIKSPTIIGEKKQKLDVSKEYIIHDYPTDPFLDILTDTATIIEQIMPPAEKKIAKPNTSIAPTYLGLIQGNDKSLAIFRYQKKYYFIPLGDTFLSYKLKRLAVDSALLIRDGEPTTVKLTKTGK